MVDKYFLACKIERQNSNLGWQDMLCDCYSREPSAQKLLESWEWSRRAELWEDCMLTQRGVEEMKVFIAEKPRYDFFLSPLCSIHLKAESVILRNYLE